jgi:hypothetical protein
MGLHPWLSLTTEGIVPHPGPGLHRACPRMDAGRCGDDGIPQTMGLLVRPPTAGARGLHRVQCRAHGARQAGRCTLPHGHSQGESPPWNSTCHAQTRFRPCAGGPMPRSPCWQGCSSTSLPPYSLARRRLRNSPHLGCGRGSLAAPPLRPRHRRAPDGTGRPFCEHLRSPALPGPENPYVPGASPPPSRSPMGVQAPHRHVAPDRGPPSASRFYPGIPRGRRSVSAAYRGVHSRVSRQLLQQCFGVL